MSSPLFLDSSRIPLLVTPQAAAVNRTIFDLLRIATRQQGNGRSSGSSGNAATRNKARVARVTEREGATADGMTSAVERVNEAFALFLKVPRIDGDRAQRIRSYMKKELSLYLKELRNRPLEKEFGGLDLGQGGAEDGKGCPWGSSGCDAGRKCFGCEVSEDAVPVDMPLESETGQGMPACQ